MRIAIDAMGGDHAPGEIVAGTLQAAALHPDAEYVLVGDEAALLPLVALGARPANVRVHHAPDVIEMDDDPARAVRRKPNSSLVSACRLVAEGSADGVFSAGNTGAVAATALLTLGRVAGVSRPCIAAPMPTRTGRAVLCDAGATVDSRPEWVVQFAIMASLYAEHVEGTANPRVALLNIGEEACKGNSDSRAAHELLTAAGVNFVGNVEGKAVFRGDCDVVACDGFYGNLLLKIAEGAGEFVVGLLKEALVSSPRAKLAGWLARPSLRRLKTVMDYAEYGGAVLLGVKGLVLIGHGCSHARAIVSALERAREAVGHGLVEHLTQRFAANDASVADEA
jgi:glycerol-3-phosphate acyltransferase PlsX